MEDHIVVKAKAQFARSLSWHEALVCLWARCMRRMEQGNVTECDPPPAPPAAAFVAGVLGLHKVWRHVWVEDIRGPGDTGKELVLTLAESAAALLDIRSAVTIFEMATDTMLRSLSRESATASCSLLSKVLKPCKANGLAANPREVHPPAGPLRAYRLASAGGRAAELVDGVPRDPLRMGEGCRDLPALAAREPHASQPQHRVGQVPVYGEDARHLPHFSTSLSLGVLDFRAKMVGHLVRYAHQAMNPKREGNGEETFANYAQIYGYRCGPKLVGQNCISVFSKVLCVGNLLHCLGSKSIRRAVERKQKPSDAAINGLKEALNAAKENSVELQAGVQALATGFTSSK
eukprot:s158_g26.t1